jgi:hypothetical protein
VYVIVITDASEADYELNFRPYNNLPYDSVRCPEAILSYPVPVVKKVYCHLSPILYFIYKILKTLLSTGIKPQVRMMPFGSPAKDQENRNIRGHCLGRVQKLVCQQSSLLHWVYEQEQDIDTLQANGNRTWNRMRM